MAPYNRDEPNAHQIESQLVKILASPLFKRKPTLSALLTCVVQRTLKGGRLSGKIIAIEVFGRKLDADETVLRANANHLRKALAKYYLDSSDLVVFDGPQGVGYKMRFSYNPRAAAEVDYLRASYSLSNIFATPRGFKDIPSFKHLWNRSDVHGPSLSLVGIEMLLRAMFDHERGHNWLEATMIIAEEAQRMDDRLSFPHVLIGAVNSCRFAWKEAHLAFEMALDREPLKTRDNMWYLAYLAATDRLEEALNLSRARAQQNPNDPAAMTLYLVLLFIARRQEEAKHVLGYPGLPSSFFEPSPFWPLRLIVQCVLGMPKWYSSEARRDISFRQEWSVYCPGLSLLLCEHYPEDESLRDYEGLRDGYGTVWELALAHLAYGAHELAMDALSQAVENNHPFAMWLHLWPMLDPLRSNSRFGTLLECLNLPPSSKKK